MQSNSSELRPITDWLPVTKKEMLKHGWEQPDVVLFTGDAYIDHPAFGAAAVGRLLQSYGLKVAMVPQPNWQDDLRDFKKFGEPKLFFAVTGGNMDSMVNHYTANRRLRSDDAYTPDGKAGARPDYATVVYCNILKQLYPEIPIIIGGIEASLRRVSHYDYWSDTLKPSILLDSKADLLFYGNAERSLAEFVKYIKKGVPIKSLQNIPQTVFLAENSENPAGLKTWTTVEIASHYECLTDKLKYASNFKVIEQESNKMNARRIKQIAGEVSVYVNPPYPPMTEEEADLIYDLPYTRLPHPKYNGKGAIPAYEMIKFSVNIHRGCFGGCAFCTISAHQGKFINSRSEKSVLKEVEEVVKMPDFKGYISDIGGPSANMYKMQGVDLKQCATCVRPSCIFPGICKNLNTNHDALTDLYRKVDSVPGVKKSFIGSGIRYDLFFDKDGEMPQDKREYATEVIANHVSGRLKVAPEHTADHVLKIMRKPLPYFISSHPGSRSEDMAELAAETKELNFRLEQVQDFTPTPMTVATVIYHSGVHPYTMLPVEVARTKEEKLRQRSFFFWYMRENYTDLVAELNRTGRTDLITRIFGSKKIEAVKNKKEPVKGKKEVETPEQEETYSFKKRKPGALKSNLGQKK